MNELENHMLCLHVLFICITWHVFAKASANLRWLGRIMVCPLLELREGFDFWNPNRGRCYERTSSVSNCSGRDIRLDVGSWISHWRFRPWPTSFHSLYNSSWLCHLEELNQVPPLCWWYPTVHFFHSFKLNFFTWNALQYFLWHTLLDELEQIAPQSIQNWILTHCIGTKQQRLKFSQLTYNFISRQWYHPSQLFCS